MEATSTSKLMMGETLESEEKSVWTGMDSTGHHVAEKLNHGGTHMKKPLWLQCLRDFGCVAIYAWESWDLEGRERE